MQPLIDETAIAIATRNRQRFMTASPGRAGFAPARTLPRRHGAGQSKTRRRGVVDRPPLMEIGRFRQEADRRLNSRAWRLKSASPA
jgi:hypothetical protein